MAHRGWAMAEELPVWLTGAEPWRRSRERKWMSSVGGREMASAKRAHTYYGNALHAIGVDAHARDMPLRIIL